MSSARRSFKNNSQRLASPLHISALTGWLSLPQSTPSSGEWASVTDRVNASTPMVQTDADRRAAVGAAANSVPTMVFDGTDVHLWPTVPATSSTTKVGIWLWYKPITVAGTQYLYRVAAGQGGVTLSRFDFYATGSQLQCEVSVTNTTGRFGVTASGTLTAGAWHAIYLQYDSSRGGDPNLVIHVNAADKSLTYGNVGAGATLTTLQVANGSALFGGATDSDTPVVPIANGGQLGPHIFAFNDNLTAAQELFLLGYDRPT